MSRRQVAFVSVLVVLTLVNLLWPTDPSPLASSSFGRAGSGHGAVYDLLSETGLSRGRSFESARRLDDDGTLWFVDPVGVCDGRIASSGEVDVLDEDDVQWPAADWIRQGGVAVVFLQSADAGGPVLPPQDNLVVCDAIGGVALSRRNRVRAAETSADEPAAQPFVVESAEGDGSWRVEQGRIYGFEEALDWQVVATVRPEEPPAPEGGAGEEEAGPLPVVPSRPFVLSRPFGEGRLVVVADSGFTHNAWLDRADAAPLAVDLAQRYGAPRFDEREHGILLETSALRYIGQSKALPVFVGLLALGVLYAWRGNALPSRSVAEFDPASPTLDTYVTSMAALYARTRDHGRVLERYCELTASRLKRHFGLPQEVSRRALVERIERDARSVRESRSDPEVVARRNEGLAVLVEPPVVETAAALGAVVRELDELVLEVTR